MQIWVFPGGSVGKNPPANAGDTDSIPGLGRLHMLQGNKAHAPQLLNLCSRAHKPQLPSHTPQPLKPARPKPTLRIKRSHSNEKPMYYN